MNRRQFLQSMVSGLALLVAPTVIAPSVSTNNSLSQLDGWSVEANLSMPGYSELIRYLAKELEREITSKSLFSHFMGSGTDSLIQFSRELMV